MAILNKISAGLALVTCAFAGPLEMVLFHMNDDHSHLPGETFDLEGNDLPDGLTASTSKVRVSYGGFPRIVSYVKQRKAAVEVDGKSVLKLHAGDSITGTSYYTLFNGDADAKMMAMLCFDAMALGNHEFDHGDQALANFIDALQAETSCPNTPVLGANVNPGDTSPLVGKLKKSITKSVAGEQVGIIGIDIKSKTELSSSPDPGTTLSDERAIAQAEIDALLADGIDKIILLTHIGYNRDIEWMANLSGVDVIVGGDSHSLLGDTNTRLVGNVVGPYATMKTNAVGGKVCIVTAWCFGHGIGEINVSFDALGAVTSCEGSPKFPFDAFSIADKTNNRDLNSSDAFVVQAFLEDKGGQYVAVQKDSATEAALKTYSDQVSELMDVEIATVPKKICFERFPGEGAGSICTSDETWAQGGGVCNLVAQAFLNQVKIADIAINNAGGCRTDIAEGSFTYDNAYSLLPFSNQIVSLAMTGTQIKELLEEALEFGLTSSSGAYPYASGLRYNVDASAAKGTRITKVEVNSRLMGQWTPIGETTTYTVATNDYIAKGKDGYTTFATLKMNNLFLEYAQSFIDYAKDVKQLAAPSLSDFSTQAYTDVNGVSHGSGARGRRLLQHPSLLI